MELIAKNTLTNVYPYNVVSGELEKAILYPYIGYISNNGNFLKGVVSDNFEEATAATNALTYIYAPTSASIGVTSQTQGAPSVTPRRFRNVKYKKTDINIEGALWSSENLNNSLSYGYVSKTTEILEYEYCEGTWKETQLPWYLGGGYRYSVNWGSTWPKVTSEWDKNTNTYNDKLTEYYRSEILQILELGEILSSRTLIYDKTSQNVKYANQVRCVAE